MILHDVVDASESETPFIFARVTARGRRLRGLKLIIFPLPRPVPNMVLLSTNGNVLRQLGIALKTSQRLNVEGDFHRLFTLYCPAAYERDALYVFTPDVLVRLMDAVAGCDVEIVDDRVMIYAPARAFALPGALNQLPPLVAHLQEKFRRQTRLYIDERSTSESLEDPFLRAQLTTDYDPAEHTLVGDAGRRLRTRATPWQRTGIVVALLLVLTAATYWVAMVGSSFLT